MAEKSLSDVAKAKPGEHDDVLAEAKKLFQEFEDSHRDNRDKALEDLKFARLGEQWPEDIKAKRIKRGRPVLTINKLPAFIRQVVNDARMNKPQIHVHPVDSRADPETAKVLGDLVRNIENTSNADIAYDTAVENAVSAAMGYFRIIADYCGTTSFEKDLMFERVQNPFSVYGDPSATAGDGSDWNDAFVVEMYTKREFQAKWGDKSRVPWDSDAFREMKSPWKDAESIMVAEYWHREKFKRPIYLVRSAVNGEEMVLQAKDLEDGDMQVAVQEGMIEVVDQREVDDYRCIQYFMTGAEILEKNDWPGRYIPIVPVFGDEFNVGGEQVVRSLVNNAVDAQRMVNYWRTTATELVALSPRVPYIGPKDAFKSDRNRWLTANTEDHAFLEFDGAVAPQRQPLDSGVAAGALQEALNASDDIKSILGIYDASLGARSNETSGRAIMARQREGDVSTFHFVDNLARAIRHGGKILIDLIPHYYSKRKVLKVTGEDGKQQDIPLNQEREIEKPDGSVVKVLHDLSVGQYDVTVSAGPSFTTRREEAAIGMIEFVRSVPDAAPFIVDKIAAAQDWPGADEVAERMKVLIPGQNQPQIPPEVQEALQQGQMAMQELQMIKTDKSLEERKLDIEQFNAETNRMKVEVDEKRLEVDKIKAVAETDLKEDDQDIRAWQAETSAKMAMKKSTEKPKGKDD